MIKMVFLSKRVFLFKRARLKPYSLNVRKASAAIILQQKPELFFVAYGYPLFEHFLVALG